MTKSSAASFIDQIKAEYAEVVTAEGNALPHAIKCGEYLTLAKENLKAEKGGSWRDWLETNCPDIAPETASLYRRLAEHKSKLRGAKSINAARKLLPKSPNRRGATATPAAVEPRTAPKDSLKSFAPDLAPDEVCLILVEVWEDDQLAQLAKLIGEHLQKKKSATPLQISTAPQVRRELPPNNLRWSAANLGRCCLTSEYREGGGLRLALLHAHRLKFIEHTAHDGALMVLGADLATYV
jgi:hypothetical protein